MKNVLVLICIMLANGSRGQTTDLIVKNGNKGLYIDHKVTPKENFYSMGRLFNVHPKHIASFNSLDMSKGLSLGQMVQIPLTDTNFNQKTEKGQPIYYVTGKNENLHRVSTNNNNVLIENLRQWNNLFNDNIGTGSKLIVGFLVTKEPSSVAVAAPQTTNKPPQESKEIAKNETVIDKPEVKKDDAKQEKELTKEQPKKEEQVTKVEPVKEEPKKDEPKKEEVKAAKQETKPQVLSQGYFKTSFDQQIKQHPTTKEQTLTSGVFKTTSGWSDAKYYLLMDGVEPGTIVRITNPTNNRMIYAKLLGEMSGLKQTQGVNIRISNAAASALDIAETDKFMVKLNY